MADTIVCKECNKEKERGKGTVFQGEDSFCSWDCFKKNNEKLDIDKDNIL